MLKPTIWAALLACTAIAQEPAESKIDAGLDEPERSYPVFVRMQDQLLPDGKAYPAFCARNASVPREKLRERVLDTLRAKAKESWDKVAKRIGKLERAGSLVQVTRFWIVNGFACAATGAACHELAKLDEVAFVYRQTGPRQIRQHARPRRVPVRADVEKRRKKIYADLLAEWKDDSDVPFDPTGLEIPWNLERVQAPAAWKLGATGKGVTVAFCDTGLLVTPALTRALWRNEKEKLDGKDDDENGFVDDVFGYDIARDSWFALGDGGRIPHGSICAGIVAGRPVEGTKIVTGIAPRARILPLRGMGLLRAYEYAVLARADVLSMSYMWVNMKLGNYRGVFRTAHEHMAAAGVVSVGGAGNFARNAPKGRQIAIPKDIPCVIAAAGIRKDGSKAPASSEGPCTWDGVVFFDDYPPEAPLLKPDVTGCFGGYPVWCTTALARRFARGRWKVVWPGVKGVGLVVGPQGNSFSGPHAAGVAALVLSVRPGLNAWQVKEILESTSEDIGPKGRDTVFGAGLLQAAAAVRAALSR